MSPIVLGPPKVEGLTHELEGDAVLFSPLLVRDVGGEAGEIELTLEQFELRVGYIYL